MPFERRWAIIAEDGRHNWLGRHSDPTDDELSSAARQLGAAGVAAWLVVTEGNYWQPEHNLKVLLVRTLSAGGDWESARALFLAKRTRTLKELVSD
jgi:hypothetical protein